jgi:hypothetical protein
MNRPLAIFATLLVIGGIAAVAYLSALERSAKVPLPVQSTSTGQVPVVLPTFDWRSTSTLVLVSDQSVTVMALDGTTKRLPVGSVSGSLATSTRSRYGVDAGTGGVVSYPSENGSVNDIAKFPSPDGIHEAVLLDAKSDGAGVIGIRKDGIEARPIVLRLKNGSPLRDAQLYGWSGPDRLIVTGIVKGERWAYEADVNGTLSPMGTLPDTAMTVTYRDGHFWYITITPGPGIESPPQPPSELFSLEPGLVDPPNRSWVRSEGHIITGFTFMGTGMMNGLVAYIQDDGQSFIRAPGGGTTPIGKVRPLMFLDEERLLIRDGYTLYVHDIPSGKVRKLGVLPEGSIRIFYDPLTIK